MRNLSTGDKPTLSSYRKIAVAFFGEKSKSVAFIDEKIKTSKNGGGEEAPFNEGQMIYMLMSLEES